MISFNTPSISSQSNTGILISQRITVQAAANATGYNCTLSEFLGHKG